MIRVKGGELAFLRGWRMLVLERHKGARGQKTYLGWIQGTVLMMGRRDVSIFHSCVRLNTSISRGNKGGIRRLTDVRVWK